MFQFGIIQRIQPNQIDGVDDGGFVERFAQALPAGGRKGGGVDGQADIGGPAGMAGGTRAKQPGLSHFGKSREDGLEGVAVALAQLRGQGASAATRRAISINKAA